MSRSRKAYLSILLLTGGGFLVDKMFLDGAISGPAVSSAAVAGEVAPARSEKSGAPKDAPSTTNDLTHLARLIASLPIDAEGGRQDAFTVPAAWRTAVDSRGAASKPSANTAAAAAASLKLTALWQGKGVILDGRYQAVDELRDGIRVVRVESDHAVLRHEGSGTEAVIRMTAREAGLREKVKVTTAP